MAPRGQGRTRPLFGLHERTLRAAREKAAHTDLCVDLANAHAPCSIAANAQPTPAAADTSFTSLLERLALEAFGDGCVPEGAAATLADKHRQLATDLATRVALDVISRDEANHAALAGQILDFCVSIGERAVRHALGENLERQRVAYEAEFDLMLPQHAGEVDDDCNTRFGLAGSSVARDARIENWEKRVAGLSARI